MKKVLAVAILLSSQLALSDSLPQAVMEVSGGFTGAELTMVTTTEIPASEIQVSEGMTDAKLTLEIVQTNKASRAACTNSRAETYAIAYDISGSVSGNILHRGYHEAILVNCSGSSQYFNVETILQTANGDRFYAKTPVLVSSQAETIARFNSSVNAKYFNTGTYTISASTNATGPGSAYVTDYGTVRVY